MARRCWPASTNFPPTGPRLRWLFCICCFCLAHALETMSKDKSGAAESLMSSSPALTTSTDTRRSSSILRRRSWRRYLSVSLCSRGFGEHKTTPICTTGSRALAVEERAFDSTPRKSNCSPTLIRHSHICSKFETRVRSGLAIFCSESEEPPQSQDFVQRDICVESRQAYQALKSLAELTRPTATMREGWRTWLAPASSSSCPDVEILRARGRGWRASRAPCC